jgi:hypothetical protein
VPPPRSSEQTSVVGLVVAGEPDAAEPAVVELDQLGHPAAQAGLHELAKLARILAEQVDVVDPARAAPCAWNRLERFFSAEASSGGASYLRVSQ